MLFETTSCIIKYCISLRQGSPLGDSAPPRGHLTMSGDSFVCHDVKGGGAGICWVEGRGCC